MRVKNPTIFFLFKRKIAYSGIAVDSVVEVSFDRDKLELLMQKHRYRNKDRHNISFRIASKELI